MANRSSLAALALLAVTAASGADYYVAASGNDTNAGSQAQPFRQIRKALTVVHAGDTIHVGDGQYLGFTQFSLDGASGSPITIQASGSNAEVIPTTDRSDNRDTIYFDSCSWIVIDGLRSFNANRAAIRIEGCPHLTIRNCTLGNNTTWGILTSKSDDLLIEDNEAYGSKQQHGIYVGNSGDRPVVRGNRIHDNVGCGLHMNGDVSQGGDGIISSALVERNTIWSNGAPNGGSCINCDGVQDSVIRNNVVYDAHASGISLYQIDGGGPASGNLVVANTIDMASNGRWALNISNAPNTTAFDNILLNHNTAHGSIHIGDATTLSGLHSDYNVVMGGSICVTPDDDSTYLSLAQWQAQGHDAHSRTGTWATLFASWSGGDYHLIAGAVAIDNGVTGYNGKTAPSIDHDGVSRPQGAGYDIGAYEVASSGSTTSGSTTSGSTTSGSTTSGSTTSGSTTSGSTTSGGTTTSGSGGTTTSGGSGGGVMGGGGGSGGSHCGIGAGLALALGLSLLRRRARA